MSNYVAPASLNPFHYPDPPTGFGSDSQDLFEIKDDSPRVVSPSNTQVASVRLALSQGVPQQSQQSSSYPPRSFPSTPLYTSDPLPFADQTGQMDSLGDDSASLLGEGNERSDLPPSSSAVLRDPNASFYSLAYYRCFFDVTTKQIGSRLVRCLLPQKLYTEEDPQPDWYGPFWICTTLIFVLAATGNLASYLETVNKNTHKGSDDPAEEWNYDFSKITVAATVFYSYITIVPLIVSLLMSKVAEIPNSAMEISSLFGYSLFPFIFSCFLAIPNVLVLRWLAVSFAFASSILFLMKNIWTQTHPKLLPIMVGVIALSAAMSLLIKIYFFDW